MANITVTLRIRGSVRQVFLLSSALTEAQTLGLVGWVKHCPGESVLLCAQGKLDDIERMRTWCWTGPRGAQVTSVEAEMGPVAIVQLDYSRFEVRRDSPLSYGEKSSKRGLNEEISSSLRSSVRFIRVARKLGTETCSKVPLLLLPLRPSSYFLLCAQSKQDQRAIQLLSLHCAITAAKAMQNCDLRRWAMRSLHARDEQNGEWVQVYGQGVAVLQRTSDSDIPLLSFRGTTGSGEVRLHPVLHLQEGPRFAFQSLGAVKYFVVLLWSNANVSALVTALEEEFPTCCAN